MPCAKEIFPRAFLGPRAIRSSALLIGTVLSIPRPAVKRLAIKPSMRASVLCTIVNAFVITVNLKPAGTGQYLELKHERH